MKTALVAIVLLAILLCGCGLNTPGDRALDTYATPEPHWTTIRQTPEPAWQPPEDYNEYYKEKDQNAP